MAHTEGVGLQQEFGGCWVKAVMWRAAQDTQGHASSWRSTEHRQMETLENRPTAVLG